MKKILFVLSLFLGVQFAGVAQDARSIVAKMTTAISNGKTLSYTMKQSERINGTIHKNTIYTKINLNPLKVYIDNIEGGNEGKRLLYVTGERSNKVLVRVNGLLNVPLSPYSGQVRKNQHHMILDSGFGILHNAMKEAVQRADAQGRFDEVFTYEGTVTYDGKTCYKVVLTDPTYTYVDYTISGGESTYQIALKKNVCEQLIIEKNSSLSGFNSAKDGMVIQIPSSYAKKTILYIDKTTNFPLYQEIYDENGLFEKYEFTDFMVNPTFTDMDFSKENESYNF